MALLKTSVRLIIRESPHYELGGPVLTLGVPEVYATHDELNRTFLKYLRKPCPVGGAEAGTSTNAVGRRLRWVDSPTFFRSLGLTDVTSIDIPGCEHPPDLEHDMNHPLPDSFADRFGFVLDPGTIEHVFDIKTALSSIVRALRLGGTVVHQVPVYSFNGGYVSVNPNLLNDFYRRNGFDSLKTFIIMWDRYRAYTGKHRVYEYQERVLGPRHSLSDRDQCRYSPHMLFMARKRIHRVGIAIPIQFEGRYVNGVSGGDTGSSSGYGIKTLYQVALRIGYQWFPFSWIFSSMPGSCGDGIFRDQEHTASNSEDNPHGTAE